MTFNCQVRSYLKREPKHSFDYYMQLLKSQSECFGVLHITPATSDAESNSTYPTNLNSCLEPTPSAHASSTGGGSTRRARPTEVKSQQKLEQAFRKVSHIVTGLDNVPRIRGRADLLNVFCEKISVRSFFHIAVIFI